MSNSTESRLRRLRRRRQTEALPDTLDPIAIAMQAANEGSRLADPAHTLIANQTRLLRLQIGSERIAIGLKLLLGLTGLVVAWALVRWSGRQRIVGALWWTVSRCHQASPNEA